MSACKSQACVFVSSRKSFVPGGSNHASQQGSLLLDGEMPSTRSLKLLPDPLTLVQVIDEHELNADVLTVCHLTQDTLMNMNSTPMC